MGSGFRATVRSYHTRMVIPYVYGTYHTRMVQNSYIATYRHPPIMLFILPIMQCSKKLLIIMLNIYASTLWIDNKWLKPCHI